MKRFNSILCVIDPDNISDTAIIQSLKIADDNQAEITFALLTGDSRSSNTKLRNNEVFSKEIVELSERTKSAVKKRIATIAPRMKANAEVYSGIGFIQIIKSVINNQHDLVIKCAEDPDWLSRIFGSEDMHLLRKCPCPVLMLKPGKNDSFRNVLATVDVNDSDEEHVQKNLNKQVLEYSAALSMSELTTLHVGSAWEAYAESFYRHGAFSRLPDEKVDLYVEQVHRECSDRLKTLVKELGDMLGKDAMQYLLPKLHLVKGQPSKEIPLMTEQYNVDLVVLGTVGRVGIPSLIIGNTAESILEQTKCSVLAIKPEGFKTPVV